MITADSQYLVRLFFHYEAGFLYQDGGISAQPAGYLEAMELLAREFGRIRVEKIRKETKKGQP